MKKRSVADDLYAKLSGGYNKTSIKKVKEKQKKMSDAFTDDERFWTLKMDDHGNGAAIIRFLPNGALNGNEYVEHFSHFFKMRNGKWFVETCPTTANDDCPVCKANSELWATEDEVQQNIARRRGRNKKNICNVLIIKDPIEPENNGKVKLWAFPSAILKKIIDRIPENEDDMGNEIERKFNPFNPIDGAIFRIKVSTDKKKIGNAVRSVPDYGESSFSETLKPIDDKDKINEIVSQCVVLEDLLNEDKFKAKPFAQLKQKYDRGMNVMETENSGDTVETTMESETPIATEQLKKVFEDMDKETAQSENTEDDSDLSGLDNLNVELDSSGLDNLNVEDDDEPDLSEDAAPEDEKLDVDNLFD